MVVGVKLGLHPAQLSTQEAVGPQKRPFSNCCCPEAWGQTSRRLSIQQSTSHSPLVTHSPLGDPNPVCPRPGPGPSTDDMELEGSESQAAWC